MNRQMCLIILFLFMRSAYGVTLVYNLRVRRIFNVPLVLERMKKSRTVASAVPVFFYRTSQIKEERTQRNVCERRYAGGSLFNIRFAPSKQWWFEVTTGIETDQTVVKGTENFRASRTGFDDIVFAGGYRHFWGDKCQLVGYGLVGLPSTRTLSLHDRITPLLGTRLYNLGFGIEASYSFISTLKHSLACIAQYRLIHGFEREYVPILPCGSKIKPGNVNDVLLTVQYRKKRTIFEGGYNATIFTNQAVKLPTQTIKTESFARHGGYATVSHGWLDAFFSKPVVCGVGCNVNYTSRFDATTVTAWVYGAVVF